MAAGSQLARERALGEQARERVLVGDRLRRLARGRVIGATLERDDSLSRRGHEALGVEHAAGLGLAPQPLQPGAREHDRPQALVGVG